MALREESKILTDRYRAVIVRSGRRFRRWRWVVEEEWLDGWEMKGEGLTATMQGAIDAASRRAFLTTYRDTERVEAIWVCAHTYEPRERKPAPIQAEYVQ